MARVEGCNATCSIKLLWQFRVRSYRYSWGSILTITTCINTGRKVVSFSDAAQYPQKTQTFFVVSMNRGCVLSSTALWTWKATCPFYPPMALCFDSTLTHAHECAHRNRGIYTSNIRVQSTSLAKLASNMADGLFSIWHWWMSSSSMSIWPVAVNFLSDLALGINNLIFRPTIDY